MGWATGIFGLFTGHKDTLMHPVENYIGVALACVALSLYTQVRQGQAISKDNRTTLRPLNAEDTSIIVFYLIALPCLAYTQVRTGEPTVKPAAHRPADSLGLGLGASATLEAPDVELLPSLTSAGASDGASARGANRKVLGVVMGARPAHDPPHARIPAYHGASHLTSHTLHLHLHLTHHTSYVSRLTSCI